MEGRPTTMPLLDCFGATYGARDDLAFDLLTGAQSRSMNTVIWEIGDFGLGKDYVSFRQIRSWFDRKTIEKEFYAEQSRALQDVFTSGGIAIATTEISPAAGAVGLWSNHAYSIVGFDSRERLVTIRDPIGKVEPLDPVSGMAQDGLLDGIFKVPLPDFNRYFPHLIVSAM